MKALNLHTCANALPTVCRVAQGQQGAMPHRWHKSGPPVALSVLPEQTQLLSLARKVDVSPPANCSRQRQVVAQRRVTCHRHICVWMWPAGLRQNSRWQRTRRRPAHKSKRHC
jgi:hypothetical protein